jgi:radical SAM superfamily enzyme YgiQ (UPF0313 family)
MSRLSLLIVCHLALWIQFTSSFTLLLPISGQRFVSKLQSYQDTIIYEEPVFRLPAEWRSLILQVTIGCSWNKCTFCEMYQTKTFRSRSIEDVEVELKILSKERGRIRDVFLADGDAMALPTKYLLQVCKLINSYFPEVRRISSYCLPRNLKYKTVEDLMLLREAGLSLVYVGVRVETTRF